MITYRNNKVLFTGDVESHRKTSYRKNKLDENHEVLKCDVLKVAHHGSSTSSDSDFISRTSAKYAIMSADSDRDLPDPEIVKRLEEDYDIKCFKTYQVGTAIICKSDGSTITFTDHDGYPLD